MKYHHLLLSGLAAATLSTGSASAALISISGATLSTTGVEILGTGTQVFAWNANGDASSPVVVNGITFSNTQPGTVATVGFVGGISNQNAPATVAHYSGNMAELMGDFGVSDKSKNLTIDLNSLTINQEYRLQLLHHADIVTGLYREMQVRFGGISGTSSGIFDAGKNQGYISTVVFKADAVTQQITLAFSGSVTGQRVVINGATLFAIPEPSAALLGGLGFVLLLRRRR